MEKSSENKLALILIALFSLGVYFNSLSNPFIFDDLHSIAKNLYIKDFQYLPLFFKGEYTSQAFIPRGMFRPLLMLTFSFNYFFGRLEPIGYHLINILLHFLNGFLLYRLLRFLKKDIPFGLSLIIALLFAAHPLNTETVSYIVCRSDLLAGFFILLAFFSYLKDRVFLALVSFALALLSKETGLVFPFLVLAGEFLGISPFKKEPGEKKIPVKKQYIFYIVLIALSIGYWAYRSMLFDVGISDMLASHKGSTMRSFTANFFTESSVTFFYLRLFLWPHPLTIHHAFPTISSFFHPWAFLSVSGLIAAIAAIFIFRKRRPLISIGIAWYLICLLPKFYAHLNLVAAEHHFYLPGFGIYLIIAGLCQGVYKKFPRQFIIVSIGVLNVFVLLTGFRNYEWRDTFILWKTAVERSPESGFARQSLALEYLKKKKYSQSKKEIEQGIKYSGHMPYLQINNWVILAGALQSEERYKEAEAVLVKLLKAVPNDHRVQRALGDLYKETGFYDKAESAWLKCLRFHPQAADIKVKLGLIYLENRKDSKQAKEYFLSAIKSNPEAYLAHFALGLVLEGEADIKRAIRAYERVIQLNPGYAPAYLMLGTIYAKEGDHRSLKYLKKSVELDPYLGEAHYNLAILYLSMEPQNLRLARIHARKSLGLGYEVKKELLEKLDLLPKKEFSE